MNQEPVLSWKVAGIALGLLMILATAVAKPLGVSTAYVNTDAMVTHTIAPDKAEANEYLSKYGEKNSWSIDYGWMLVIGIFFGAVVSSVVTKRFRARQNPSVPDMWQQNFGSSSQKRWLHAFVGGVLLLFGARLAGGCTSGHMMSGISQLTVGSFVFGIAIFASGIATAKYLYRGKKL
ncbi:MAG: YeeE/YedE family protein [Gammaproteobacteria bacterium]|nr:YeeE/YedE family protein [Gammaproteobacteria bacterium]NNC96802.1 YeeE/YedE family protein [Gammaproteobacteria bacterium]NNM14426.1 YeeE/YedE family protein [Gammaproteobacteria bacterium]